MIAAQSAGLKRELAGFDVVDVHNMLLSAAKRSATVGLWLFWLLTALK
jgi:hypothetical protein